MNATYKLHVKIGANEFNGEGPEKAVKADYEAFRRDCQARDEPPATADPRLPGQQHTVHTPPAPAVKQHTAKAPLDPLHDKAFLCDDSGVSLRTLPNTGDTQDQDALILLIYGIQVLKNQRQAGSVELGKAVRQSGIKIDKLYVTLDQMDGYVQKGGQRRSTRYVLNNQGINRAREIMQKMFPA